MPDEVDNPSAQVLERKLATILSADVAEFSRLMGEDEEQTLRTFGGHKQVFESLVLAHRGRVFNTAGDAILAEFTSAVEAVRCATDIQAALRTRNDQLPPLRQVRFRIGINLGDVMLHGQDLLGDGVNVAARLQTAAAPGGICISGSVHDQIRNKLSLSFLPLGEMNFKNIQQPVRTFSIIEADGQGSLPSPKPRKSITRRVPWLAGAVLIVLATACGAYFFLHRPAPKLTDRDTIVLADFTNSTGDPVFDGTLRQGLSAQLEQSPFLSLILDERIAQTLGAMAQPKESRLTKDLARVVCQRTASAATIEGSIAKLGSQYVLGLKAVNCHTGDLLAQQQVTTNGKEQVLTALGDAATKLRAKLGESLTSVQKYDVPLENVTTPSLEALQAYSLGYQAIQGKSDYAGAIPFFQRAISLDPDFAMAYARLGRLYEILGEPTQAAEITRKAYQLRERTSELEKFYISSHYQFDVLGNLEASRTSCELWAQTYPRDEDSRTNLRIIYAELGDYEKALVAEQQAIKISPGSENAYLNLVVAYVELGRLDEAKATAQQVLARNFAGPGFHEFLYLADFVQHDAAGMAREAARLIGEPGWADQILFLESQTAVDGGELLKARHLTRLATDSAQRSDKNETAAGYGAEAAVHEALVGNMDFAKQEAQGSLALLNGKYSAAHCAIAFGLAGDSAKAARLADDLGKRFPQDSAVVSQYVPMIRASIEIRSGEPGKAVEALSATAAYELGMTNPSPSFALYPVYLRGEAYLAAKQGPSAAVEFQKILDHPGLVLNDPIGALAHLDIGRAYALAGDSAKAKSAYQDFFALWKNADPNIPILKQAKAEYAKLK